MIYIDFDGVLFDTLDISWKATAKVFHDYGVSTRKSAEQGLPLQFYIDSFWGTSWLSGLDRVATYYHGPSHGPWRSAEMRDAKDSLVRAHLSELPAPVNTGALAMLVFAAVPVVFCTAGGPNMASFKASLVSEALARVGSKTQTTLICNVDKTSPTFWKAQQADIVIDDDIRVIKAAEQTGLRTIHWREFLPKGA